MTFLSWALGSFGLGWGTWPKWYLRGRCLNTLMLKLKALAEFPIEILSIHYFTFTLNYIHFYEYHLFTVIFILLFTEWHNYIHCCSDKIKIYEFCLTTSGSESIHWWIICILKFPTLSIFLDFWTVWFQMKLVYRWYIWHETPIITWIIS